MVMTSLTSRVSAVMIIVAATAAACASSSPPAPTPPPTAPSEKVAKTEASPAAPLPTTLLPGVGMSTSKPSGDPDETDDITGPPPVCSKDEDCWSKTCCPAKAPEDCVHASRARKCAIVDITCKPSPMHYTCVCDSGSCKGRLAPP
jgi:hypothetical protein